MRIQNRIALHLKAAGISQAELSRKIGISTVAINRWCKGHFNPADELQQKVADVLGVPKKDLFYLDSEDGKSSIKDGGDVDGNQSGS